MRSSSRCKRPRLIRQILGLMVGAADVTSARAIERDGLPGIAMNVPEAGMRFMAGRIGQALPIGNEGCGVWSLLPALRLKQLKL